MGPDIADIHQLSNQWFAQDNTGLFSIDHQVFDHNITRAVVDQFYDPLRVLLLVARDGQGQLAAWTWATRGEYVHWSSEEMIAVNMVHVDLSLPARDRVQLIQAMMGYWEDWARACGIGVICSTTMRRDQAAFLRLHQRAGYDVRGSIAYRRLDLGK